MRRTINLLTETDWLTVILYLALVIFGWMNIYSVNYDGSSTAFFSRGNRYSMQLAWIGVSILLAIFVFLIDSRFYTFISYPAYGFALFVLLLVIVVGKEVNGAKSWIMIGPVALQPSEMAKITTILALSRFLSGYNVKPNSLKNILISLAIIAGPPILIMLQPDFGSTLVYGSLLIVMYREGLSGWILLLILFLAGMFLGTLILAKLTILVILILLAFIIFGVVSKSLKITFSGIGILLAAAVLISVLVYINLFPRDYYLILFASLVIATIVFLILAIRKKIKNVFIIVLFLYSFIGFVYSVDFVFHHVLQKHQRERVEIMLGMKSDPWGYEYNVNQSKIAIGSGGFGGRGYMKGPQTKLKYVPEQSTDFIFCTVGEEWGFIGSFALVLLFVGLIVRLIVVAERQRSRFSRIYAYGVVSILFFHFAVNIAMTVAIFPVIGIPLPFMSYGGSSLMAFTIMLFILLKLDATRKAYLV